MKCQNIYFRYNPNFINEARIPYLSSNKYNLHRFSINKMNMLYPSILYIEIKANPSSDNDNGRDEYDEPEIRKFQHFYHMKEFPLLKIIIIEYKNFIMIYMKMLILLIML